MKKLYSLLLMIAMCVSLAACGNDNNSEEKKTAAVTNIENKDDTQVVEDDSHTDTGSENEMSTQRNTIVVYFSATGNTQSIAESIANGLSADIYEIVPKNTYSDADLDYNDNNSRSTLEMNDVSARPEILGTIGNFEQYDTVFLGYPIWWGEAPRIMDTFVESYDFTGKTIIPFCTSASSGIGSSADTLEELAGTGNWMNGQRFNESESADKVLEWAKQF